MSTLGFSSDSFSMQVNTIDANAHIIQCVFTANNVANIDYYVAGVPLNTPVAGFAIKGPGGGLILTGSLYYTGGTPPTFSSDYITINPPDQIVTVILNFAYSGPNPFVFNDVFGGSEYTMVLDNGPSFTTSGGGSLVTSETTFQPTDWVTNDVVFSNPLSCYVKGTKILTPDGYMNVENLKINDKIITGEGKTTSVIHIYKRAVKNATDVYCIPKNFIKQYEPMEDLYISGGHIVKINNNYHHTACLNKQKFCINKIEPQGDIEYYHIKLDNWFEHTIVANGIKTESYYDGKDLAWICNETCCSYYLDAKIYLSNIVNNFKAKHNIDKIDENMALDLINIVKNDITSKLRNKV